MGRTKEGTKEVTNYEKPTFSTGNLSHEMSETIPRKTNYYLREFMSFVETSKRH